MWISQHEYNKIHNACIMEGDALKFRIRLLEDELAKYQAREKAAPEGCMTGTHCAGCKNVIITGPEGRQKYDCKLVAAKLCDRFEEATP